MGHFGLEVINLGRAVGSDRRLLEHPEALAPDSVRSEDLSANATAFQASCTALSARGGGTIIVPERYYLGKPVREMLPDASRSTP